MDLFSRKIIGCAMRDHLRTELPLAALMMALQRLTWRRLNPSFRQRGPIRLDGYRAAVQLAGSRPSMSRKADCLDNAPMESFFHTIKTALVHHQKYATGANAQRDLFAFIEGFYNWIRLHSAIGYISPVEMERETT
jgi:putative transposase